MDGESLNHDTPTTAEPAGDGPNFALPEVTKVDDTLYQDKEEIDTLADDSEISIDDAIPFDESDKTAEDYRGALDDKGRAYDPALHTYPPEMTPSGIWKKIPKKEREKMNSGAAPQPASNAENRLVAQTAAKLYAGLHVAAFGELGLPAEEKDFINLIDGFEAYFNENGAPPISSRELLLMSMTEFTTPIVMRETNLEKVKKWGSKIGQFFKGKKGRKKKPVKGGEKDAGAKSTTTG